MFKNNIKRIVLVLLAFLLVCCSQKMTNAQVKVAISYDKGNSDENTNNIDIQEQALVQRKLAHERLVENFKEEPKELKEEPKKIHNLSKSEIKMLAQLIMAEAEGESMDGKIAVGQVILNRMVIRDKTMKNIIHEKISGIYQFSCVKDGRIKLDPSEDCYKAVDSIIYGEKIIDDDVEYFTSGYSAWHKRNLKFVETIDNHDFYKE